MSFSYTLVSDTFTRADSGTLGPNWTASSGSTETGTFGISSNAAVASPASNRAASYWTANSFANDQWSEVLANSSGSANRLAGVCLRATSGDNLYICTINFNSTTGGAQIAKVVSGTFT